MSLPGLVDVMKISGEKRMSKKVIKASEAAKKVEELTQPEPEKRRSASDIRQALYGKKE